MTPEQAKQHTDSIVNTLEFLGMLVPLLRASKSNDADAFGVAGSLDVDEMLSDAVAAQEHLSALAIRLSHLGLDILMQDPVERLHYRSSISGN